MTDNTNNVISDESLNVSESERLAAEIQDMIFAAVSTPENEESVTPAVEEPVILPENAPEPLVEVAPVIEEEAAEEKPLNQEDEVEPIEVEEEPSEEFPKEPSEEFPKEPSEEFPKEPSEEFPKEPSEEFPKEPEVVQEVEQVPAEVFIETETPEEDIVKTSEVSRKLPSSAMELLNNIGKDISRIIVAAPSEKEDPFTVALYVAMGLSSSKKVLLVNCNHSDTASECPTDMENLSFMSSEKPDFDLKGFDTVVYSVGSAVNTEALTVDCGVLLAVKPKVTTYGAYRKALKSLHKSQAKILGAVIV